MSTTARGTTEACSGDSGKRTWLDGNNEECAPVYILDEKVRSAKRHSSSHDNSSLFDATHVTVQRSDDYAFHEYYTVTSQNDCPDNSQQTITLFEPLLNRVQGYCGRQKGTRK